MAVPRPSGWVSGSGWLGDVGNLRDGPDIELAQTSREEPMIDLMAISAVERDTEVTYIRREADWATRAAAEGRLIDAGRLLPVLPATTQGLAAGNGHGNGNGHAALGSGHDGHGAGGGHAHPK